MPDLIQIAGIVLAGGKSSRMGRNKALLDFKGRPLVRHMMGILNGLGLKDVYISGSLEGYTCIGDDTPHEGPVRGINNVLQKIPTYNGYLFVPVDMPFLTPALLNELTSRDKGGYFTSWPLPLFLLRPIIMSVSPSVQGFIDENGLSPIDIPPAYAAAMVNLNTPQEWEKAMVAS